MKTATVLALLLLAAPAFAADPLPDLATELARFPPPCVAGAYTAFAAAHLEWVETHPWPRDESPPHLGRVAWEEYWGRAKGQAYVWSCLQLAHDPQNCDFARGVWLLQLRDGLPAGWYEVGRMPAPIPALDDIWR